MIRLGSDKNESFFWRHTEDSRCFVIMYYYLFCQFCHWTCPLSIVKEQSLSLSCEPYKNATCQSFLGKEQKERETTVLEPLLLPAFRLVSTHPPTHTGQTAFPCRFAFSLSQLFGQIIFHEIWATT